MPRQQEGKENTRKVQRSKGMYYISVPLELMRKLGWRERQKVVVNKFGKGLRVKDWVKKRKS
jgi:hypothetical protein